jgi:putative oxidoreductase
MIADAARAGEFAPTNPIARFTSVVFGFVPAWLPLLVLRLTLARPFFASGLTRWDGWFTLSFGTKALFAEEYKLHVFGAEIPFPAPELVATMASTAEIVLPILLAVGFLTRWAALGLLVMTGIIQLTYPDGWANFHLYWAAMALAIITFGPGAISLDRLIGLDGWIAARGLSLRKTTTDL